MTRSAAKRRNRNALMIVAAAKLTGVSLLFGRDGVFTADSARRMANVWSFSLFCDMPIEVNWPLCADLLNRKAQEGSYRGPQAIYDYWSDRMRRATDTMREIAKGTTADIYIVDDPIRSNA